MYPIKQQGDQLGFGPLNLSDGQAREIFLLCPDFDATVALERKLINEHMSQCNICMELAMDLQVLRPSFLHFSSNGEIEH